MKSFFFLLLLFSNPLLSKAQSDSIVISGELKGQGNYKIIFEILDGGKSRDTIKANQGKFSIKFKKKMYPIEARLFTELLPTQTKIVNGTRYGKPSPFINFFMGNSDLFITGSIDKLPAVSITGDSVNNELTLFRHSTEALEIRQNELSQLAFKNENNKKDTVEIVKMQEDAKLISQKLTHIKKEYIEQHPASLLSLYFLKGMENPNKPLEYVEMYNKLSDRYKKSPLANGMTRNFDFYGATAAGKSTLQFSRKDKDGKIVNMKDYKGKYVLLDFWGSWCGPCRMTHPHLKELYSKYKSKGFEIIAIANERGVEPRKKWLEAIAKDELPWVHILNNEEKDKQNIVKFYNIIAFPTKILVDTNGNIIRAFVGGGPYVGEELDKELEKIFG